MKRIVLSFAVLALLIGNYAYATTYTYTGGRYNMGGSPYDEGMRVTGTLVTSSPIPPNSGSFDISDMFDISGILTSWSFSDGVQTIDSSSGEFHPSYPPIVMTDGQGLIINSFLVMYVSPIATTVGATDDYIGVGFGQSFGTVGQVCATVVDEVCADHELPASYGQANTAGTWEGGATSTPIPTLSQWSLMLLALVLGMLGIARVRRQV